MTRTQIRDKAAAAALRIARRLGVELNYIAADGTSITVWGLIESSSQDTGLRSGGLTDNYHYVFVVPRQTSFPPAAFGPGIKVRYVKTTGTVYEVESVEPDNEDILQASTFRLKCGRFGETAEID